MFQHGGNVQSSTCQAPEKNMIFRGCKEIAYINRAIALYSSHMKEKWIIHRGKENVLFTYFS